MPVDFSGPDVESIEQTLEEARPGNWRRLGGRTVQEFASLQMRAGWSLRVHARQFEAAAVDQLYVLIDTAFPASEARIVAPRLKLGDWPHIEPYGLVCLRATSWAASPGDRVRQALAYAEEVLNLGEAERATEFAREFSAYWQQFVSAEANPPPLFITLMPPHPVDTEVFFARLPRRNVIVLSDTEDSLRRWLQNSGEPTSRRFPRTRLRWLQQAWPPSEFPRRVSDVLGAFDPGALTDSLRTDESLPVLFGATTPTGNVFVGVEIPALSRQRLKGFRAPAKVPGKLLAAITAGQNVTRCRVERGDPAWVHGRDRDHQQALLVQKRVGLVGCGALGSALARQLAQMGVGHFVLVDHDNLTSANTSRHLLGADALGTNKATAVAERLQRDFPDLNTVVAFPARFQHLSETALGQLARCDLVVSAGINWPGDIALDTWRRALATPPVHLCTWAEEFALAGHSLALFGQDSIVPGFSADGVPITRLTDWPPTVQTQIIEAGCGNLFQPHGVVDLTDCATLAARLAIDLLTSVTTASCRRVWLGNRSEVERLGGVPRPDFDVSYTRKVFAWPPGAA